MEFANPYEQIPPSPTPTKPFAEIVTVGIGATADAMILPVLTGGKRYRLFDIMAADAGGNIQVELWSATVDYASRITAYYTAPLIGNLSTPMPYALPPTGLPVEPNTGILRRYVETGLVKVAACYLNIAYAIE